MYSRDYVLKSAKAAAALVLIDEHDQDFGLIESIGAFIVVSGQYLKTPSPEMQDRLIQLGNAPDIVRANHGFPIV